MPVREYASLCLTGTLAGGGSKRLGVDRALVPHCRRNEAVVKQAVAEGATRRRRAPVATARSD